MTDIGTRVFAIRDAGDDFINLFGFGTYVGDLQIPGSEEMTEQERQRYVEIITNNDADGPVGLRVLAVTGKNLPAEEYTAAEQKIKADFETERQRPMEQRCQELHERVYRNPCIHLSGGDIIWGYQCWWGPLAKFTIEWVAKRIITHVPVPEGNGRWR